MHADVGLLELDKGIGEEDVAVDAFSRQVENGLVLVISQYPHILVTFFLLGVKFKDDLLVGLGVQEALLLTTAEALGQDYLPLGCLLSNVSNNYGLLCNVLDWALLAKTNFIREVYDRPFPNRNNRNVEYFPLRYNCNVVFIVHLGFGGEPDLED